MEEMRSPGLAAVLSAIIPGIGFLTENRRFYPGGPTAAHALGLVNVDNQGIAGLEKYVDDKWLADLHAAGFARGEALDPVRLSLDISVQHILRDELVQAMGRYHAIAASGIILGIINLTGIGLRLSSILVQLAGGEVFLLLVMTMIACLVLGMGLPVTASYMIPALMVGPAFTELGIPPLAGHLFILYFGVISNITPPFALAAYAGAGIAGSDPVRTGFLAFRLGIPGFILPYMFVYSPALIMEGPWLDVALAVVTAVIGVAFLTGALTGYLLVHARPWERALLLGAALVLIKPGVISDLVGLAVAVVVLRAQLARLRQRETVVAAGRLGIPG